MSLYFFVAKKDVNQDEIWRDPILRFDKNVTDTYTQFLAAKSSCKMPLSVINLMPWQISIQN